MAIVVARIDIPNATLTGLTNAATYFVPKTAALGAAQAPCVLTSSATLNGEYVFDISQYSACQLIATTAGMTGAAGCVVGSQAVLPETQPLPVAGLPIVVAGTGFANTCAAIAATAASQAVSFNSGGFVGRSVTIGITLTFTTVPSGGADLWIYLLGFPWKSYE